MDLIKWLSRFKVETSHQETPLKKEIVFLHLTERVIPCFNIDEYDYELAINITGIITKTRLRTTYPLKLQEYESMLKKLLAGVTIERYSKVGYKITLTDEFKNSPARLRILSDVGQPKKERRYS